MGTRREDAHHEFFGWTFFGVRRADAARRGRGVWRKHRRGAEREAQESHKGGGTRDAEGVEIRAERHRRDLRGDQGVAEGWPEGAFHRDAVPGSRIEEFFGKGLSGAADNRHILPWSASGEFFERLAEENVRKQPRNAMPDIQGAGRLGLRDEDERQETREGGEPVSLLISEIAEFPGKLLQLPVCEGSPTGRRVAGRFLGTWEADSVRRRRHAARCVVRTGKQ